MLSFAKPDCTYAKGSLSFAGTGLEFSAAGSTVKVAVAKLKATSTNTRVLLAVGGGSYKNWQAMNGRCLQDIVDDFGLDGKNTTLAAGSPFL
jgi:chitinase